MPQSHNGPLRPAYIQLAHHPYSHYTSGDVIRGTLRVHPTVRPSAVKISFKARCKVKIIVQHGNNNRSTYKGKTELFSYGLKLFESSHISGSFDIVNKGIAEDGKVELPFEFAFPNSVELKPGAHYKESKGFEHKPGHPLPPSLCMEFSKTGCMVNYWLEAQVFGESGQMINHVLPFRPSAPPIDHTVLIPTPNYGRQAYFSSRKLHPDYDPNEKFFRRIKNSLTAGPNETSWAKWNLVALVPSTLLIGAQVPVEISFQHLERSKELLDVPPVFIRRAQVKLLPRLTTRVPYQGFTHDRDIGEFREEKRVLIDKEFPENSTLLYDGLQFSGLGSVRIPKSQCPSFRTYGARLEYIIQVRIKAECATESVDVLACHGGCELVCDMSRLSPPLEEPPPPFIDSPSEEPLPFKD